MAGRIFAALHRVTAGLAVAALGALSLVVAPAPAVAQGISAGCALINTGFYNFDPVPANTVGATRTETFPLNVGDAVTVSTANLLAFFFSINGAAISTNPNGTVTFVIVTQGNNVFFKSVTTGPTPGSVRFSCVPFTPPAPPPPPEPTPTPTPTTPPVPPRDDFAYFESPIPNRNFDNFLAQSRTLQTYGGCDNDFKFGFTYRNTPVEDREEFWDPDEGRIITDPALMPQTLLEPGEIQEDDTLGYCRELVLSGIVGDVQPRIRNYYPQPRIPSVEALSRYFNFDGNSVGGTVPLQSDPDGWTVDVVVDGAIIDRTFAALSQRTFVGTLMLTGRRRIDAITAILGTLKLSHGVTTQTNPAGTMTATAIGGDVLVGRMLTPLLYGSLAAGYEAGVQHIEQSGATGDPFNHLFKAAAQLEGTIHIGQFVLSPSGAVMLQYRRRLPFATTAGTAFAALDTLEVNGVGGVTLSRDFVLLEQDLIATPYASLNLRFDGLSMSSGTPPIPVDPFRAEAVAGVRFVWESGMAASLQADVSRGKTTTVLGVTSSVSVPLH